MYIVAKKTEDNYFLKNSIFIYLAVLKPNLAKSLATTTKIDRKKKNTKIYIEQGSIKINK